MAGIRLAALDADDLAVVSTHLQDAVLVIADLLYRPKQRLVALALNRFDWLETPQGRRASHTRRRTILRIERVERARLKGMPVGDPKTVLSLLALTFVPAAELPAGTLTLVFSGGAEIQLDVECIEVALSDVGPAWLTPNRPEHGEAAET